MKMNVQILSKELVKPSTPTPPSLKNYKISLIDELSPKMNVPLILYYYPSDKSISTCKYLKDTLATTLNQFYLLAGRYVKDSHTVDCNDQGVEFVKAQANFQLNDLIGQKTNIKIEFLNDLIPSSFGALDEITDPLLSIQLTVFDCGGLAIGVCVSHRVADLSTISTFLGEWAKNTSTWGTLGVPQIPYSFDSALFFPGKDIPGLQLGFSRSKENMNDKKIATRVFCFNNKAISSIKGKVTRVQSVLGIIWKAIVDINKAAKHGPSSDFIVIQPVNMREKTIPPFSKYSCGNLYMSSVSQYFSNEKEMGFHDFSNLLSNSVKSTLEDCAKILSCGEEGQMMLINPFVKVHNIKLSKPDVSTCCFTSWCRFPFYETDFGWGKPVWVSTMNPPLPNSVILIDDKEGEGIEAWVSLDENDMNKFQENCIIKKFTT